MRRWMMLAIPLSGAVLAWSDCVPPVAAQPFGFFGAAPRATRLRASRSRPRPGPPVAAVPLPVPRPRFAQDPAAPPVPKLPVLKPAVPKPAIPKPEEPPAAPSKIAPQVAPAADPPATAAAAPPPAATKPAIAASGATNAINPRKPDNDALCPGRLNAESILAEPTSIGPQPDARCTVAEPVRLAGLTLPDGGAIDFPDRPLVACITAERFATYVRDLLSPLAKGTFGARVGAVWTGPGLECRSRDHIFGAKLSAHGQGLAVDVARLKLEDGQSIAVGEPRTPRENAFETAARAGGCGYFNTVLGPGSDSYHRTHWHFDLEVRGAKGDTKYCH